MPEVCRFNGITIRIYYREHSPPHFHAVYGEHEEQVAIATLAVLRGSLPARCHRDVMEWAAERQEELWGSWHNAQAGESPGKIAPLG